MTESQVQPELGLQRRLLGRDHLRFYRAVMDGVEPRKAWSLYLPLEDEFSEAQSRSVIAWTRQSLLAQAVSLGATDLVGVLRRDPRGMRVPSTPTLEQFAAQFADAGDFSEQELLALWQAEHGSALPAEAHRSRLARRLREAIDRLESALQRLPAASDPVGLWLAPNLADRLTAAGLPTLGALRHSLNQRRAARWPAVPGVGAVWADRLQNWLVEQDIAALPDDRAAVQPIPSGFGAVHAVGLVPLERLPAAPTPSPASPPVAAGEPPLDDRHCIADWLQARAENTHTLRLYRRVAERLLLWCRLERRVPLLALGQDDASSYLQWLQSLGRLDPAAWTAAGWRLPADSWIARAKGLRRDSSEWRPFDGPPTPSSSRQDRVVLRAMFAHFLARGWVGRQPFDGASRVSRKVSKIEDGTGPALPVRHQPNRADPGLDPRQWSWLLEHVQDRGDERAARLRVLLWLLGPCGLRPAEALALRLADLVPGAAGPQQKPAHVAERFAALHIPPFAGRERTLVLPPAAALCLKHYLERVNALDDEPDTPVLRGQRGLRRAGRPAPRSALGYSSLQEELRQHFLRCAEDVASTDERLAERLRKANARWLRGACAAWSLQQGVDLTEVQHRLGHASLLSTGKLLAPR